MQKVLNVNKLVFIWVCFVILSCSSAKEIINENQINVLNTIIQSSKSSVISLPILFRNNTMAIYYNTETSGGSLTLLQKRNSKWKIICSSSVWIE
jgi:hypothetical protein